MPTFFCVCGNNSQDIASAPTAPANLPQRESSVEDAPISQAEVAVHVPEPATISPGSLKECQTIMKETKKQVVVEWLNRRRQLNSDSRSISPVSVTDLSRDGISLRELVRFTLADDLSFPSCSG